MSNKQPRARQPALRPKNDCGLSHVASELDLDATAGQYEVDRLGDDWPDPVVSDFSKIKGLRLVANMAGSAAANLAAGFIASVDAASFAKDFVDATVEIRLPLQTLAHFSASSASGGFASAVTGEVDSEDGLEALGIEAEEQEQRIGEIVALSQQLKLLIENFPWSLENKRRSLGRSKPLERAFTQFCKYFLADVFDVEPAASRFGQHERFVLAAWRDLGFDRPPGINDTLRTAVGFKK